MRLSDENTSGVHVVTSATWPVCNNLQSGVKQRPEALLFRQKRCNIYLSRIRLQNKVEVET